MKVKIMSLALVLVMVAALFGAPSQASAAAIGYGTKFATAITYQNVGSLEATLSITFYPSNGDTPVTWTPELPLQPNAGSSLFVGSVGEITSGFQGSAMMVSNQPMVAVLVQIGQYAAGVADADKVLNRPLSVGLSSGSPFVLVPTVLKGYFNNNTIFVVQNADTVANDLTVTFVPAPGSADTAPVEVKVTALGVGMAQYYDMPEVAQVASPFNGSVTIEAVKTGTTTPGAVVATALELATKDAGVKAFEGTSEGGTTLYMPSAFCKYRGGTINSAYAIQNNGTTDVTVNVTYTGSSATPGTFTDGPYTVTPGGKKSLLGCTPAGIPEGFIGSAVIEATGGTIVGIGKITGNGISSAFNGLTSGAQNIALPYIRFTEANWTNGKYQRSNIAIQNVGAEIPAGQNILVEYYDKNGTLVGTHTIPGPILNGAKVNSNPLNIQQPEFGQPTATSPGFGGGAVVKGPDGSQLAVLVRVESFNVAAGAGTWGEDYNGIAITLAP